MCSYLCFCDTGISLIGRTQRISKSSENCSSDAEHESRQSDAQTAFHAAKTDLSEISLPEHAPAECEDVGSGLEGHTALYIHEEKISPENDDLDLDVGFKTGIGPRKEQPNGKKQSVQAGQSSRSSFSKNLLKTDSDRFPKPAEQDQAAADLSSTTDKRGLRSSAEFKACTEALSRSTAFQNREVPPEIAQPVNPIKRQLVRNALGGFTCIGKIRNGEKDSPVVKRVSTPLQDESSRSTAGTCVAAAAAPAAELSEDEKTVIAKWKKLANDGQQRVRSFYVGPKGLPEYLHTLLTHTINEYGVDAVLEAIDFVAQSPKSEKYLLTLSQFLAKERFHQMLDKSFCFGKFENKPIKTDWIDTKAKQQRVAEKKQEYSKFLQQYHNETTELEKYMPRQENPPKESDVIAAETHNNIGHTEETEQQLPQGCCLVEKADALIAEEERRKKEQSEIIAPTRELSAVDAYYERRRVEEKKAIERERREAIQTYVDELQELSQFDPEKVEAYFNEAAETVRKMDNSDKYMDRIDFKKEFSSMQKEYAKPKGGDALIKYHAFRLVIASSKIINGPLRERKQQEKHSKVINRAFSMMLGGYRGGMTEEMCEIADIYELEEKEEAEKEAARIAEFERTYVPDPALLQLAQKIEARKRSGKIAENQNEIHE